MELSKHQTKIDIQVCVFHWKKVQTNVRTHMTETDSEICYFIFISGSYSLMSRFKKTIVQMHKYGLMKKKAS